MKLGYPTSPGSIAEIESIVDAFARQVERQPDAVALVEQTGEISYWTLEERASRLARLLLERGVEPGSIVPLPLERSADFVIAILAVLKCGAAYLPLDSRYPLDYVHQMLADARPVLGLGGPKVTPEVRAVFQSAAINLLDFKATVEASAVGNSSLKFPAIPGDAPAYVIYTSGSTGTPKGVVVPQRAILRLVIDNNFASMNAADVWLHHSSTAFDAATLEIWAPLLNGGRCVIFDDDSLTPFSLRRAIELRRLTSLWLGAALFNALVEEDPAVFKGLKQVLLGGEVLSPTHVAHALNASPEVQFINGYGPTENTTFTCTHPITRVDLSNRRGIPIGTPIAGTTVRILDELLQPVPIGTVGELYAGGAGVALGYLARPELTAERFTKTELATPPSPTIYRTGDLVRQRTDGVIEYLGRTDRQVKLRGFRIELAEIEYHLTRIRPVTQAALAIKIGPDGNDHLVAYLKTTEAAPLDENAIRENLRQKLPLYAIPRIFITVNEFPITVNGKLDLNALPDPWREVPCNDESAAATTISNTVVSDVAASEDERRLCKICAAILGRASVQPTDNLLEIGANSLHAMRLTAQIQHHWAVRLRVADVMRAASLADTIQLINSTPADSAEITPGQADPEALTRLRQGPAAPQFESILEAFQQVVEALPNAVAVQLGDEKLTYRQLNQQAENLARVLAEAGVVQQSIVPLAITRSLEHVVAVLAVLKLGGVYLPVDFKYPAEYIRQMLADSRPNVAVCGRAVPQHLRTELETAGINQVEFQDYSGLKISPAPLPELRPFSAEDTAYIMFTSGSTGQPKGVLIPHRAVLSLILKSPFIEIGEEEVWLYRSQINFDCSTLELWAPLLNGGRCVIWPEDVLTPAEIRKVIKHARVKHAQFVPSFFNALVDEDPTAFRGLKQIVLGGEAASPSHVERALAACPQIRFLNTCGPTEDTVFTCAQVITAADCRNPSGIPIGQPVPDTKVVILDENLQPVAPGEPGELCTGGAGVAHGYLNRPELTAERFLRHEFATPPSPFLYRSGDLVRQRLEDKVIEHLGRIDRQVKIRGFRIELGEIEFHLQQLEGVLGAVVTVKDGPGGGAHLVAYLKTADGTPALSQAEFQDAIRRKLPPQSIPKIIMILPEFPTTDRGKLDLEALPNPWAKSRSDAGGGRTSRKHAAAGKPEITPQEQSVLEACRALLQLPDLTLEDSLFDCGGTSLHAMRLAARIDERYRVRVRIPALLRAASLREIAELVTAAETLQCSATKRSSSEPGFDADPFPLSSEQRRLWFLCTLHPESPAFHLNAAYTLKGPLDPERLQNAFQAVIRRHDALRVSFTGTEGRCQQQIADSPPFTLEQSDLSAHPEATRVEAAIALARQDSLQLFALRQAPLIRARLTRLAEEYHLLSLTKHHLITDAWSLRILLEEVSAFYNQSPPQRPAPRLAQHIRERAEILESPTAQDNLSHWCALLADSVASEVPTDFTRQPTPSPSAARIVRTIPAPLLDRLRKLAAAKRGTLHTLILAAFLEILARHSGSRDLTIGVTLAERHTTQSQNLFGFLVQSLPFRTDLSGNPTFATLLKRVTANWFEVLDRQDVAFDAIVQAVAPQRDLARNPLFQILFNHLDYTDCQLKIPGLACRELPYLDTRVAFDLSLDVQRTEDATNLALAFDKSLYQHATARRIIDRLLTLLDNISTQPDLPLSEIPMLPAADLDRLLTANFTQSPPTTVSKQGSAKSSSIAQTISAHPAAQGPRLALAQQNDSCTFEDLQRQARAIACALCRQDTASAAPVTAVFLEGGSAAIAAFYASLLAGVAFIPLDPTTSTEHLQAILRAIQPDTIITSEQLADRAATLLPDVPCIKLNQLAHPPDTWQPPTITPEQVAYHLGTRTPEGAIKIISQSQQNFRQHLEQYASIMNLVAADRVSVLFGHNTTSALLNIFAALLNAATIVILDPRQHATAQINATLAKQQPSVLHTTPTLFRRLCAADTKIPPFAAVRALILSGEPVTPTEIKLYQQHCPASATLTNLYTLNESATTLAHTVNQKTAPTNTALPLGVPFAGSTVELLDEAGNPAEVFGQIAVVGEAVATSRAELAPENELQIQPLADGRRRFRTGDWAKRNAAGSFTFVGCQERQLTVRGVRVNLIEIENTITSVPAISECRILLERGPDSLSAYYLPLTPPQPLEALIADLRGILPHYLIPERWVEMENLPLLPAAKIDETALRVLETNTPPTTPRLEPRDEIERLIAQVWQELLPETDFSIHTNFFQIGGYSLLAVQLVARIKLRTGHTLPLSVLFEKPTVAHLAEYCRSGARVGEAQTIVTLRAEGDGTPLFLLPGSGGSPYGMMPIVQNTKYDGPCHAVVYPGFLDNDGSFENIPDLAAQLLKAVRKVQPVGPYRFVGFSFGGGVVFEMVQQLQADQQTAELVVFIDAFAPRAVRPRKMLRRLLVHLRQLFTGKTAYRRHLLERLRARVTGQVEQAAKPTVHQDVEELAEHSRRATDNYYPKPVKGDLVLMTAGTRPVWWDFVDVAPLHGWAELFLGKITEHQIELDHLEMVEQNGARKAGAILTALLQKIEQ